MSLRLPCERCAVVQLTRAMNLSPSGAGYLCWRCEVSAQIAEHQRAAPRSQNRENAIIAAVCVAIALLFLGFVGSLLLASLARIC